jgi:predicted ester cyclase
MVFILAGIASPHTQAQNAGGSMSENNAHAKVIHQFYEECFNQSRLEELPELFQENVVNHNGNNTQTGLKAFEQGVQRVQGMFPSGHFTVDDIVTNGDKAATHWTMTATHTAPVAGIAPTGKPIVNHGVVFYRFENGKIAELWVQVDQIGVLQQIGVNIPGVPVPVQQPAPAR